MWGTASLACSNSRSWLGGAHCGAGRLHNTLCVPTALSTAQRLLLQPQLQPLHQQGHAHSQQHDVHQQTTYMPQVASIPVTATLQDPPSSSSSSSSSSRSSAGSARAEHERQAAASMRKLQSMQAQPRAQPQPQRPVRRQHDVEQEVQQQQRRQEQQQAQQLHAAPAVPQLRWRSSAVPASKPQTADLSQKQQTQQQPQQASRHVSSQQQPPQHLQERQMHERQRHPSRWLPHSAQMQQHTAAPAGPSKQQGQPSKRQPPLLQEPVVEAGTSPSIFPAQQPPFSPSPVLIINNGTKTGSLAREVAAAFGAHSHVLLFTSGHSATWSAIRALAHARKLLRRMGDPRANLLVQPTLRGGRAGVGGGAYALDLVRTGELRGLGGLDGASQRELRVTGGGVNDTMRLAQTLASSVDSNNTIVLKAAGEYAVVNALAAVALARRLVRTKQKQELAVLPKWESKQGARIRHRPVLRLLVRVCDMGTGAMRVVDENWRAGQVQRTRAEEERSGSDGAGEDEW